MDAATHIRILIGGDVVPHSESDDSAWAGLSEVRQAHDLFLVNLECPLTLSKHRIVKNGPHLAGDPRAADWLARGGINAVSLANNHIADCGHEGIADTIEACRSAGISIFGAGPNIESASSPWIVTVKGKKIAFIGVAEEEFSIARSDAAGAAPFDPVTLYHQIASVRDSVDFVIVLAHTGNEYCPYPNPNQIRLCRFAVDVGADAIVCTHAHVPSGWEMYRGHPIVYVMGNLFFRPLSDRCPVDWFRGYLVGVELSSSGIRLELFPYTQHLKGSEIAFLTGKERYSYVSKLEELSRTIADPVAVERCWKEWANTRRLNYMSRFLGLTRPERYLLRCGLWPRWRASRKNVLAILNYLRCESHRQAAMDVFARFTADSRE